MKNITYFIILLTSAIWSSCRSVKYMPVEVIRYDTTYINKVQRDSIYQLDSVYILDRGDTVLITKTKYIYRDKLVRDTVYVSQTDSIQVPYPVEKQLSCWQQIWMNVGRWTIVIVIILLMVYIIINKYKIIRK